MPHQFIAGGVLIEVPKPGDASVPLSLNVSVGGETHMFTLTYAKAP